MYPVSLKDCNHTVFPTCVKFSCRDSRLKREGVAIEITKKIEIDIK